MYLSCTHDVPNVQQHNSNGYPMSTLGERVRAAALAQGTTAAVVTQPKSVSTLPGFLQPVGSSDDLTRILAIPRRSPEPSPLLARDLTNGLRRAIHSDMQLWPLQAFALDEARKADGLLGAIAVGGGKTLTCLLMPVVMGARNTVLMVPPALRTQLFERHYPEYIKHWRLPILAGAKVSNPDPSPGVIHVVSYSELSSIKGADRLERLQPDLIVCDEAHRLAHSTAARTKRFLRYARPAKRLGKLRCVFVSGTLLSRSIKDFAHLSQLALGANSPIPAQWTVLEEWAGALDDGPFPGPPGALLRLCQPGEEVRNGFRRRLVETPGVVVSSGETVRSSLIISTRRVQVPEIVTDALTKMRSTWCTPAGEEIDCALSMYGLSQQLAAGLFYRRVWPRGEPDALRKEWLESRNNYFREMRNFLTHRAKPNMDSPKLLTMAAKRGQWNSEFFGRWDAVHRLARPATEVVWVSPYLAEDAAEWASQHKGVVWTDMPPFGRKVAELAGIPYYGAGEQAAAGIVTETGRRSIVAGKSHALGTDGLQQRFSTQLVTYVSPSGKEWTQQLGRLHREGQPADEVTCEIYQHTSEVVDAFQKAIKNSHFLQTLTTPQKLTFADITL